MMSLARSKETAEWRHTFRLSLFFAVPVFALHMIFPMLPYCRWLVNARIARGLYVGDVASFALTAPAQWIVGRRFYASAWRAVKHRSATMDVLVVLGTSASLGYSTFALLAAPFASDPNYRPHVVRLRYAGLI